MNCYFFYKSSPALYDFNKTQNERKTQRYFLFVLTCRIILLIYELQAFCLPINQEHCLLKCIHQMRGTNIQPAQGCVLLQVCITL